jgi:thiosulfate/3-mercaptopyruvate sulfurtransferase
MRRNGVSVFGTFGRRCVCASFLVTVFMSFPAVNAVSWPELPKPNDDHNEGTGAISSDSWQAGQLVGPEQFSRTVSDPQGPKPLILCVAPNFLYRSGHIPGAKRIGAASQPEGLENLQKQVRDLPRAKEIVIYCGCCPWQHCPNVAPAFGALQRMGFTNVKVLHLPSGFKQDWTDKGFPVQRGE